MKTYKCKVRLAGSVHNEVRKFGVTVPEIMVLRQIHGPDAVIDIKPEGDATRTHAAERDRLAAEYGGKVVAQMFGQPHLALPNVLPDIDLGAVAEDEFNSDAVAAEQAEAAALAS